MVKNERINPCDSFGSHRVIEPKNCLPQTALRLDNKLPIFSNEVLIDVEKLNIDAASFVQMANETQQNSKQIASIIIENCRQFGKQENRVTGSGGMLMGCVREIGSRYKGPLKLKIGDRIATLVSLTLTPLNIKTVHSVDLKTHRVDVSGFAILFETSLASKIPPDLNENIALAAFDVAGAPSTVNAMCRKGDTVVVLGAGGKSGVLSLVSARKKIGSKGKLIAIEKGDSYCREIEDLNLCDHVLKLDATNPLQVQSSVSNITRGKMGNVVVNVASVPNTEMSAILSAGNKGTVLFFSMATSFTKVALQAEAVNCTAKLLIGNGYFPNHASFVIQLIRRHKGLRELLMKRYQH